MLQVHVHTYVRIKFHVTLRDWFYFSMAVPFHVCTTLLSSEEVEKILDDPPSDKVSNLPPVKPKGGEVYLFKPADDSQKGFRWNYYYHT